MEFVVNILILLVLLAMAIYIRHLKDLIGDLEDELMRFLNSTRPRQSRIRGGLSNSLPPSVDYNPVTARRDTEDIPRTGRGSRLKFVRKGGDVDEGIRDDGRLPPDA